MPNKITINLLRGLVLPVCSVVGNFLACNQNSAARGAMIFLGGAITYNKFSYGQLKYKL